MIVIKKLIGQNSRNYKTLNEQILQSLFIYKAKKFKNRNQYLNY